MPGTLEEAPGCMQSCTATLLWAHLQEAAEGVDAGAAAETATTTDSESVSDIQLVRGGGEQRTVFKLKLQVRCFRCLPCCVLCAICQHHVACVLVSKFNIQSTWRVLGAGFS